VEKGFLKMDNDLLQILYKYALVPMAVVFWWLFKKVDYRLEKTELANATIQKELELRMQTIEKAIELRVNAIEKSNIAITIRLDSIKEYLSEIKDTQKKMIESLHSPKSIV
jgi:hypothetical protein